MRQFFTAPASHWKRRNDGPAVSREGSRELRYQIFRINSALYALNPRRISMAIESMYTAVSALQAHQQYLSVVPNNLANQNTIGFNESRVLFSDALSPTLQQLTASSGLNPGGNGIQIGLGVSLSTVTPIFTQGSLQSTGVPTDLAIDGP